MDIDDSKKLTHEIFEQTGLKVGTDDPAIILAAAINAILSKRMEQYDANLYEFTEQYIQRLNRQLDDSNLVLEDKIQDFGVIADGINQDFDAKLKEILIKIDDKNKELNFILTKIQAGNDKAAEEQFSSFLEKVQHQVQLLAKKQAQLSQQKYREMAVGGIAFGVGIFCCMIVMLLAK